MSYTFKKIAHDHHAEDIRYKAFDGEDFLGFVYRVGNKWYSQYGATDTAHGPCKTRSEVAVCLSAEFTVRALDAMAAIPPRKAETAPTVVPLPPKVRKEISEHFTSKKAPEHVAQYPPRKPSLGQRIKDFFRA